MTVVAINNINETSQEFMSFKNSLQFQDWVFQTQNIIQATGLPIDSNFSNKNTLIPNGSFANRFGHKTLADFITRGDSSSGLNMDWSAWVDQHTAFKFKNQFGIFEDDISEVLSQVKDIETALGRMPINSAEYHKAKEEILLKQKREAEVRHQSEKRELSLKIDSLVSEISEFKQDVSKLQSKLEVAIEPTVLESYVEQLRDKEHEIISLKAQVRTLESNIGYGAELNIDKLISDFQSTMSFLERFRQQNKELKQKVSNLASKVADLESKLISKDSKIRNLTVKNKNLFSMQLLTGSVFFITTSALLMFLLMLG